MMAEVMGRVNFRFNSTPTAPERAAALDDYLIRWVRWMTAGLDGVAVLPGVHPTIFDEAHKPYEE